MHGWATRPDTSRAATLSGPTISGPREEARRRRASPHGSATAQETPTLTHLRLWLDGSLKFSDDGNLQYAVDRCYFQRDGWKQ